MSSEKTATKFKIIATPPGQAPEWVRQAWIGLELPLSESTDGLQSGVLGGRPENLGGYSVSGGVAIDLLLEKNSEAAQWWQENMPGIVYAKLVFKREVCELVN